MFSRVDSGTALGGALAGAGIAGEVSQTPAVNIMEIDILCGLIPGYYLQLTGAMAIVGTAILIISSIRGYKERQRRIEREKEEGEK